MNSFAGGLETVADQYAKEVCNRECNDGYSSQTEGAFSLSGR